MLGRAVLAIRTGGGGSGGHQSGAPAEAAGWVGCAGCAIATDHPSPRRPTRPILHAIAPRSHWSAESAGIAKSENFGRACRSLCSPKASTVSLAVLPATSDHLT